jgi:transposase
MSKAEQTRLMAWRLRVLQEADASARSVARTCRRFGLSRRTFYKWRGRYKQHGAAGLCDRPRTPQRSPHETPRDVVRKILYLRQHYHFGPGKIADYLKRFHRIAIAGSSVHRILARHGMNRLPANQKHGVTGRPPTELGPQTSGLTKATGQELASPRHS